MAIYPCRLILDTNIVVRAFINLRSSSGKILKACENRRVTPLLSREILAEYNAVLRRQSLVKRYPELENPEVGVSLQRLIYVSDFYRRMPIRFAFPRDTKDAPFLELAIAGRATHLITTDDDLLSLAGGRDETSKRLRRRNPRLEIETPDEFVKLQSNFFT